MRNPEIIFEANGVYSCRLQAFLEENSYDYTRLNPLEAKKQLDSLRVRKTDKIDAGKLASSQFVLNRKPIYVQEKVYQNLHDLSRFYQNLTEDIVRTKNRLHKVLQVAFPEIEILLSTPAGKQYWNLVSIFPTKHWVLELSEVELKETIRQSTSKRISENRVGNLAEKLVGLVKQSYSAISKTSPIIEEVKYNAQKLIRLTSRREQVLEQLIELAKPLPEYVILLSIPGIAETTGTSVIGELGDIRRFTSANQINAFIGIDLKHYE